MGVWGVSVCFKASILFQTSFSTKTNSQLIKKMIFFSKESSLVFCWKPFDSHDFGSTG